MFQSRNSVQELFSVNPALGNEILNRSLQTVSLMNATIVEAEETFLRSIEDEETRNHFILKLCQCRFYDIPPVPEFHKPSVGMIRSDDLGHLVQFSGTVIRTGMVGESSEASR